MVHHKTKQLHLDKEATDRDESYKNGRNIFRPCFRQGINIRTVSRTLKRKISLKINNNKKFTWFDLKLGSTTK